jgi:hypothetical protein
LQHKADVGGRGRQSIDGRLCLAQVAGGTTIEQCFDQNTGG